MNNKLLAVLAVAVFLASGSVAVAAAPSDAEGEIPLGTVFVDAGGEATVLLKFNELSYTGDKSYEFTMKAGVGESEKQLFYGKGTNNDVNNSAGYDLPIDNGTEEPDEAATDVVTIKAALKGDVLGVYTITLTVGSTVASGPYSIYIDLDVITHPAEGTSVELETVSYVVDLKVTEDQTGITFSCNGNLYVKDAINAELTTTAGIAVANYDWYAIGLPSGLNVVKTDDGKLYLRGLTTQSTEEEDKPMKIQLVGRDTNGNEIFATFSLTINAERVIKYYISTDGTSNEGKVLSNNNDTWAVKTNSDKVILTIEDKGTYDVNVIDLNNEKAQRVDAKKVTDPTSSGQQFYVPINGAGAYSIEIIHDGGTKIVSLHIVADAVGSGAGFVVIGGA